MTVEIFLELRERIADVLLGQIGEVTKGERYDLADAAVNVLGIEEVGWWTDSDVFAEGGYLSDIRATATSVPVFRLRVLEETT